MPEEEEVLSRGVTSVVRVGDTVRRATGPWTPAVHALLRHLEHIGFDGAPRVLGIDAEGREVLTYVEGETPALPPPVWAATDEALAGVARLLRGYHDAVEGFEPPADAAWRRWLGAPAEPETICRSDLQPPNVVFRAAAPVAFIDWDFAAPGPRLWDVAAAAANWVPLGGAEGWPPVERGPRLRMLCDVYGLERNERARLLDLVATRRRVGYESHRRWAAAGVPGFVELWAAGSGEAILSDLRWLERSRPQLEPFLR